MIKYRYYPDGFVKQLIVLPVFFIMMLGFLFVGVAYGGPGSASYPTINLNKDSFTYGDKMTLDGTVNVLTDNTIEIKILDPKKESLVTRQIPVDKNGKFSFEYRIIVNPRADSTYFVQYTYYGLTDSKDITIRHYDDTVLFPVWVKTVAEWWVNDDIQDLDFIKLVKYLADNEMLDLPDRVRDLNEVSDKEISRIKENADSWQKNKTSDNAFQSSFIVLNNAKTILTSVSP